MSLAKSYSLDNLDAVRVSELRELLRGLLEEKYPDLSFSSGALEDLVLELNTLLGACLDQELQTIRQWGSIQDVLADSSSAPAEVVDRLLSFYQVTRLPATAAKGSVRIVVSSLQEVLIPAGSFFRTAAGMRYRTTTAFIARTTANQVVQTTDRLLVAMGANRWYFLIDVEAELAGAAGNQSGGVTLTPLSPPANFVTAVVQNNLTGGAQAESNASVLSRLLAGASARIWSGRSSIEALLRSKFPSLVSVSVAGCGDSIQLRDKHGLFPVSTGGRVDVWVRSSTGLVSVTQTLTATLQSKSGSVGTWQIPLGRGVVPGWNRVVKILTASQDETATGFAPATLTRGFDLSGVSYPPDIVSALEASSSFYQSASLTFEDTITNATALSVGSTASYKVILQAQPNLEAIQKYLEDPLRRPDRADVLVRGCVPAVLTLSVTVRLPVGSTPPTLLSLQQAIAEKVNSTGFSDRLTQATISEAVSGVVRGAGVDGLSFSGTLYRPDGTTLALSGTQSVQVSEDATRMVSGKSVCFFVDPASITVTLL